MAATKSITFPPARWPFFLQESEWQYQTDFALFKKKVFASRRVRRQGTIALLRCLIYGDEVHVVPGENIQDSYARLN